MTGEKTREKSAPLPREATGIPGMDDILNGGLPARRLYLVQGHPGAGKTTFALQFLLEGARRGQSGLYITLSETKEELNAVAASHDWDLSPIALQELSAAETTLDAVAQNTLFYPAEVELGETVRLVLAEIDRVSPTRVVFDSLSELRMLSQSPLRFRRQILALKQYLAARHATVLMLEDVSVDAGDLQLQSLAHGVIALEQNAPMYGTDRRRLRVVKLRGSRYLGGYHDFRIETGGIEAFPRLVSGDFPRTETLPKIASGMPDLDSLLGGGLDFGTSALLLGPAGSGKTVFATKYAYEGAIQGHKPAFFLFEEGLSTFYIRSKSLGMDLAPLVDRGDVFVQHIDPAELMPGELVERIRNLVENEGVRTVVLDSVNGYLNAMLEENFLVPQMHELLNYLRRRGVLTILVMAQHGFVGTHMNSPVDVSYLADTVVLLRYFESGGRLLKAISVVKKRIGGHETSIREYAIEANRLRVGKPLTEFRGLLSGIPTFTGKEEKLFGSTDDPGR